ncbi:MAG: hypothetical protein AAFV88_11485, partial [Planctomycetota bacterium]
RITPERGDSTRPGGWPTSFESPRIPSPPSRPAASPPADWMGKDGAVALAAAMPTFVKLNPVDF